MRVIDLHQDLVYRLRSPIMLGEHIKLSETKLLSLYPKHYSLVLTAVYPIQAYDRELHNLSILCPYREIINQLMYYEGAVRRNSEYVEKITSYKEYEKVKEKGKTAFLYYVEGLYGLYTISDLEALYNLGVRGFTLAWSLGNNLASGCGDKRDFGLTDLGEKVIEFALENNMLIDIAHLGEKAALDIFELADRNVFASHVGVKALTPIARNVSDEVISKIVDRKGVIGLIYFKKFLKTEKCKDNGLECFYEHLRYIIDNYGYEYVAIGSDFYGILPHMTIYSESNEADDVAKVLEYLKERLSKKELEHLAYKNFEEFLKRSLK